MYIFKNFTKVTLSLIIIIGLAVAAALLPTTNKKQTGIFSLSSETEKNLIKNLTNQENIDLLFFTLSPKKIINFSISTPKISRPALDNRLTLESEKEIPKDKIILTKDTSSENLAAEIKKMEKQQYETRILASSRSEASLCIEISNQNAAEKCKDEISFQKAIIEAKPGFCNEIKDGQLKKRCEISF